MMTKKLLKIILCFLFFLFNYCSLKNNEYLRNSIVNFDHLDHLTQTITLGNETCDIIHIYAEYPDYNWVDASNEGIACVDDVARAAVVYLRYYEISGIDSVLERAKNLLNFILYMQADDGDFYNFIDSNYHINKLARTSQKSFDFWAARGYWALSFGYKIFKSKDVDYADNLKNSFLRCKLPIKKILRNYRQYVEINNYKYPQWLVNKVGSDATSALLLGFVEFLKVEDDPELKLYATQFAEGIMAMQMAHGTHRRGAFLSWIDVWHAWGNAQTQAFTSLGNLLQQDYLINAAKREADNFYISLLVNGMLREWHLKNKYDVKEFPQLSYGIRCISLGLLRLFEATGNEEYAKLAGLAASWLLGNNAAETQMYDPLTGRCFDGVIDSSGVNYNSGAESTIEALYTITEIFNNPIAKNYFYFKTFKVGSVNDESNQIIIQYRIFKNNKDEKIALIKDLDKEKFWLLEDNELGEFLKLNNLN